MKSVVAWLKYLTCLHLDWERRIETRTHNGGPCKRCGFIVYKRNRSE